MSISDFQNIHLSGARNFLKHLVRAYNARQKIDSLKREVASNIDKLEEGFQKNDLKEKIERLVALEKSFVNKKAVSEERVKGIEMSSKSRKENLILAKKMLLKLEKRYKTLKKNRKYPRESLNIIEEKINALKRALEQKK